MGICPFDQTTKCDIKVVRYCQSGRKHRFFVFPGIIISGKQFTNDDEIKDADYTAYICSLGKERLRTTSSNLDESHAKIVLSRLLKSAQKKVEIYCSEQDLNTFNKSGSDLRQTFHEFLKNLGSIQVEVLLEDSSDYSIGLLRKLKIPNQIKIKAVSPEAKRQMKWDLGSENEFHMLLVDGKAYRYEYNPEKHEAICSFDDAMQCKQLSSAFARAFRSSSNLF